ncbi:unnamed protein product [Hydatigera taeniaeformis]|uniref:Uncharacterized protein n=1 Tax=Hydatigena taeniaeformis TaxID=6205 RepID=A0A0R3X8N3_HYDTA|nr:unnamed protein product [Hydatigera taeniaeformis]
MRVDGGIEVMGESEIVTEPYNSVSQLSYDLSPETPLSTSNRRYPPLQLAALKPPNCGSSSRSTPSKMNRNLTESSAIKASPLQVLQSQGLSVIVEWMQSTVEL